MINDEEAASKLARAILADITLYNKQRYDDAQDRFHELKHELAEGRALFRQRVEAKFHDVYEHAARTWAKHDASEKMEAPPRPTHAHKHDHVGAHEEKPHAAKPEEDTSSMVKLGAIIFAALIAAFAFAEYVGSRREEAKERGANVEHAKDTQRQTGTSGSSLVDIPGCKCVGASSVEVALKGPPADRSQPWSVEIARGGHTSPTVFPFPDHPGAVVTPTTDALAPHFGMACDENVFVLIAGDTATAWSSLGAAWKWNRKLPDRLVDDRASRCTSLSIRQGEILVPLASGQATTLSVD